MTNPISGKRICMIAYTRYTTDGRVRLEAETLSSWGNQVCFIVPKSEAKPGTRTLNGVTLYEVNVRKYQGNSTLTYLFCNLAFLVCAFLACTRLHVRRRFHIVHVHNMPDVLVFAALIPSLSGAKVILDVHDSIPETYEAKFGRASRPWHAMMCFEERISCRLAHKVICVNYPQRDTLIQRGIPAKKIATVHTIPKYKKPECKKPVAPVTCGNNGCTPSQTFRLVNHGTISKRLGNDLLIEAAMKLRTYIPGFELHFVSGGDGLEEVRRLSRSRGVEHYVYFHPPVPWESLPDALEGMDAGIVANRRSNATELMLPAKLIDYVALGIPAIVPELKGIEYYFGREMVSYFEPENTDSMVEATLSLYRDKARRLSQAALANQFITKYDWNNPDAELKLLYGELCCN